MTKLRPVSERIDKIREMYRTVEPTISISRYKLMTEFYLNNPQLNGILKRAKAYRHVCQNLEIDILDHEMIVGSHSPTFRGSAVFPDNGAPWIRRECVDSNNIEERTVDPYFLADEDREYIKETIGFWENNSTSKMVEEYLPAGYADHSGSLVTMWPHKDPAQAPVGHFIVGHKRVIAVGMRAIKEDADRKIAELEEIGIAENISQYEFYRAVSISLEGAMTLAQRYSDLAAEKAAACDDPKRKAELELISETMARVPADTPRTFFEAAQCVFFTQMVTTLDAQLHGTSFGRVDQYLGKFYDDDLAAGRINAEQGQEIIDFFMLKIAEQNKAVAERMARNVPGYTSGQLITIGGIDRTGKDVTNAVTYMILQASARLALHDPPVALRVHENTPDELWAAAIETNTHAGGVPTYQSDSAIIPVLQARGLSVEDAREYGMVGCVEPGGNGNEWSQSGQNGDGAAYFLMPNALLEAINDGINPMRMPGAPEPRRTGVSTGYLYEMETFDQVKEAYRQQIEYFAKWSMNCTSAFQYVMRWNQPVPIASATIEGCMESGRDVMDNGAKYTSIGVAGVGIGNVADSLAAIKYLCFDTKKVTTREFYDALMSNWQGDARAEEIRGMILKEVPHFGNGDKYVDELAGWAADVFAAAFNGKKVLNGTYSAGIWPVTTNVTFGAISFATPDGRYTSDAFSDGISGVQGRDVQGPLAVLGSVAHVDSSKFGNGTLLNMRFHPSAVNTEGSRLKLIELMKTYMFDMKGMEMQLNIISSDTMRAARENPDEYRDLVVRIAGFSAYFVEISEEAKDDLIARTELQL